MNQQRDQQDLEQDKMTELQSMESMHSNEVDQLKSQISDLHIQLESLAKSSKLREDEISGKLATVKVMAAEKIKRLLADNQRILSMASASSNGDSSNSNTTTLSSTTNDATALATLQRDYTESQAQVQAHLTELTSIKNQFDLEKHRVSELIASLRHMEELVDSDKKQIDSLHATIADLQRSLEEINLRHQTQTETTAAAAATRESQLRISLDEALFELSSQAASLSVNAELETQIEALRVQVASLDLQTESIRHEYEELKATQSIPVETVDLSWVDEIIRVLQTLAALQIEHDKTLNCRIALTNAGVPLHLVESVVLLQQYIAELHHTEMAENSRLRDELALAKEQSVALQIELTNITESVHATETDSAVFSQDTIRLNLNWLMLNTAWIRKGRTGAHDAASGDSQSKVEQEQLSQANLQRVLEQFEASKDNEIAMAVDAVNRKLVDMTTSLELFKERANTAETQLAEIRGRIDTGANIEQDLQEKNALVGKLRRDLVQVQTHLAEAMRRIRSGNAEESVDRNDEKFKVGLVRTYAGATDSISSVRGDSSSSTTESFMDMWIGFLVNESNTKQRPSDVSNSQETDISPLVRSALSPRVSISTDHERQGSGFGNSSTSAVNPTSPLTPTGGMHSSASGASSGSALPPPAPQSMFSSIFGSRK
ncbi:hypothetical protein BSLG_005988 [Batrachochytrium salamandrivorans]|nr:hypothetical protein BSLG_005988 [Batrachochytrium salamandrivorans]